MLVLKRLDDARRDGDRIYAVIRSIGTSSDGKGQAVYAPSAAGQARHCAGPTTQAGIAPQTVELVEAHGTGTRVGDATELTALEEVYGGAAADGPWCALGSVKSQIGHTKAAAGAAGLIKAALALHHKVLPPTTKVQTADRAARANGRSPFYLNTEARPWLRMTGEPRRAAVSAFGFGGSNFHCVLEEAGPAKKPKSTGTATCRSSPFRPISRRQSARAARGARTAWPIGPRSAATASRSRPAFRRDRSCRLLLVVAPRPDRLARACWPRRGSGWTRPAADPERCRRPDRTARPRSPASKAAVFCGAGHAPGTARFAVSRPGIAVHRHASRAGLPLPSHAAGDRSGRTRLAEPGDVPISSRIYPRSGLQRSRAARSRSMPCARPETPSRRSGRSAWACWRSSRISACAPSSSAATASASCWRCARRGGLTTRRCRCLAAKRGGLMAVSDAGEEPGAMLAVFAAVDDVRARPPGAALSTWSSPTRMPRGSACSPGRPPRSSGASGLFAGRQIATHALERVSGLSQPAGRQCRRLVPGGAGIGRVCPLRRFRFSPIPRPFLIPPMPGRLAPCWPVSSPGRSNSSPRSKRCTGWGRGRSWKSVRTRSSVRWFDAILEGQEHHALAVDASRGSAGNVDDLACTLASLAGAGVCRRPLSLGR